MIFSFPSPVLKGQLGVGLLLGLRLPIAQAHTGLHDQAGILSGLLHPLLGIDHLFAMLAVGILASRVMSTMVWRLPAIFLTLMVLGACSGMALGPLPGVESMIAVSLLIFGGLMASRSRSISPPVLMSFVGLFGGFHGYAHGLDMMKGGTPIAFGIGFLIATTALHGFGMVLDRALGRSFMMRAIGLMVGGSGLFFLMEASLS